MRGQFAEPVLVLRGLSSEVHYLCLNIDDLLDYKTSIPLLQRQPHLEK